MAEFHRHLNLLKEQTIEIADNVKGFASWKLSHLVEAFSTVGCLRLYQSDFNFITTELTQLLDNIEHLKSNNEVMARLNGEHLRLKTLERLRLVHAFFDDANRESLFSCFDSLSRQELDARTSEDREQTHWEKPVGYIMTKQRYTLQFPFPTAMQTSPT